MFRDERIYPGNAYKSPRMGSGSPRCGPGHLAARLHTHRAVHRSSWGSAADSVEKTQGPMRFSATIFHWYARMFARR